MLPLDVRDEAAVRTCVDNVQAEAGRIDVLVSNAGHMVFGPAEEVPFEDARAMFDTNFWGAVRVVNAVLPRMRERGGGHVVLVGSIAAIVAIPMNAFYAASKSALARYAEALRHETARFGVHVVLVEPADFRTDFWKNAYVVPERFHAYAELRERVLGALRPLLDAAPEPIPVASAILKCAESDRPPRVIRVGAMARRVARMRDFMPERLFDRGLRRRFGLDL